MVVKTNNDVVQVKYTNHALSAERAKSFLREGREKYMLLIGSDPRDTQKGAGSNDLTGLSSSGSNQAR